MYTASETGALDPRPGAEEGLDVGGEFGVVLEQEPVRRVGVDLHPGVLLDRSYLAVVCHLRR
jgi:hypothetical protein